MTAGTARGAPYGSCAPTASGLVDAVRAALAAAGDPARAAEQQRYMKSVMPFHGIRSSDLRRLLRPVLSDPAHRLTERAEWEQAVRDLWDDATHREERYAAIELTGHRCYRRWQDPAALSVYEHLVRSGAWWDLVDPVAANRVGPILAAHRHEVEPVVRSWAQDPDVWVRRAAILSQLTHREDTDPALLLACLEPSLDDPSFWARKAIGWALRQYARTDPDWVRATVARLGDRLSPLSRREAVKHL